MTNKTTNSEENEQPVEASLPPEPAEEEASQAETPQKASVGAKDFAVKAAKSVWSYIKEARVELLVLVGLFILDLITKALVARFMYLGESIQLIPNFLYITYVRNTRAAFGSAFGLENILSDDAIRIIFLIVTVVAMGVFFYLLVRVRKRHLLMRLAFAMIISGALGNFYDRLVLHFVRDFIEFKFLGCKLPLLGTSFPVFNIADSALTVGVVLFIVYFIVFFKDTPEEQPKVAPAQAETASEAEAAQIAEEEQPAQETVEAPAEQEPQNETKDDEP